MSQRIALPAPPADLFIVMGVAIGADVEPGYLLRAQMRRHRILVLLAPASIDHRLEEAAAAELHSVPRRPRQRTDGRRQEVQGDRSRCSGHPGTGSSQTHPWREV